MLIAVTRPRADGSYRATQQIADAMAQFGHSTFELLQIQNERSSYCF
tara:strand:+ start:3053 stop:3193 length:141 start_codon:yes stop_codon:yes gene_type:complete